MHELATVEVSENLLLEVPHHFVDYMVLRQITTAEQDLDQNLATEGELLVTERSES